MKKLLLLSALTLAGTWAHAQTELITNGDFESSPLGTGWSTSTSNGSLWVGSSNCTGAGSSSNYTWAGDQNEISGVNNLYEDLIQAITIPSNANTVTLYLSASINTAESPGTAYDYCEVSLQDANGSELVDLGYLDNTDGSGGITGCQNYVDYSVNIPSSVFGQTVYLTFEFSTDGSLPTIFRLDDISVIASSTTGCTYSVSPTAATVDGEANTISNVASVSTQTGCTWSASVTQGGTWLSTSSSGTGSGSVDITVTQNNTGSDRIGVLEVAGNNIQITQEAYECNYSISVELFECPDNAASTYSQISEVSTSNGCDWEAMVTDGSTWLICNSDGSGDGDINITVTENTTTATRTGVIQIENKTMIITQPAHWSHTGVEDIETKNSSISPNPAQNELWVKSGDEQGFAYEVFDQLGRLTVTGKSLSETSVIDINELAEGVYILRITYSDESVETQRFIKSN